MALPVIEFNGNITADPELRFTPNGKAVVNFSVACNSKKDEQGNQDTTFLNLEAWGAFAENIAAELRKGNRVGGKAQWRQQSYEAKDGSGKRTVYFGRLWSLHQEISQFAPDGTPQPQSNAAAIQPSINDPWGAPAPTGGIDEEVPF